MILLFFGCCLALPGVAFDLDDEPTHSPEVDAIFKQFEDVKTKLIEGDIVSFQSGDGEEAKMSALRGMSWTNGDVPVEIHSAFSGNERKYITDAIAEIHEKTCVRFRARRVGDRDYILVVKPPNNWECSSPVGRTGGAQQLNLAPDCLTSRRVILHEFLHALGFIHEQNRADRDDYVRIIWENVNPNMKHNFEKRTWTELTLMDTGYAYESIMHYGEDFMARTPGLKTLIPHRQNVKLGGWERLSDIDVLRINRYYGCGGHPPAPATQPPPPPAPRTPCGNGCMWTMQMFAPDPNSNGHYLQCAPSFGSGDIRCGTWVRKECFGGMKFNRNFGMCSFW